MRTLHSPPPPPPSWSPNHAVHQCPRPPRLSTLTKPHTKKTTTHRRRWERLWEGLRAIGSGTRRESNKTEVRAKVVWRFVQKSSGGSCKSGCCLFQCPPQHSEVNLLCWPLAANLDKGTFGAPVNTLSVACIIWRPPLWSLRCVVQPVQITS